MENYYIEVEQQGSIVEMFRIKANSEEQAERIARQLMLENYDFNFVSADQMASDYDRIPIIDENGEEVTIDELEEDEEIEIEFKCPSWWYDVYEIAEERKDEFEEFLEENHKDSENLTRAELKEAKTDFARKIIAEDREEFSRRAGNDIKVYGTFGSFTISGPKSKIVELIRNEYGDSYTSHDLAYLAKYVKETGINTIEVPAYFEPAYDGNDEVLYESLSKKESLKDDVEEKDEDEKWVLTFEPDAKPDEEEMQEVEEDDRQNGIKSTFMLNHWIVVGPKSKLLELIDEYDLDEGEYALERKEG